MNQFSLSVLISKFNYRKENSIYLINFYKQGLCKPWTRFINKVYVIQLYLVKINMAILNKFWRDFAYVRVPGKFAKFKSVFRTLWSI